jgi:hypothetical protein
MSSISDPNSQFRCSGGNKVSIGDWRATEWEHIADFGDPNLPYINISIRAMQSPFYEGERYAVNRGDKTVLSVDGEWEYSPLPSSRDDAFYERCRFKSFDAAVKAADAARIRIHGELRERAINRSK